MIDELSFIIRI